MKNTCQWKPALVEARTLLFLSAANMAVLEYFKNLKPLPYKSSPPVKMTHDVRVLIDCPEAV